MKQLFYKQMKVGVTLFIVLVLSSSFVLADFQNVDCKKNQKVLGISTAECKVLEKLWESTNGKDWLENKNWDTLSSVSTWDGVVLKNNKVSSLLLYSNNLKGKIPSELRELTALERLSLSHNRLSGEIPTSIGELSQLVYLELSNNSLSGIIPSSLGSLSHLNELYLNNNQLSGKIPDTLGDLESLEVLKLYENNLDGEIPLTFGALSNLDSLSLAENALTGSIPLELGELSKLTYLDLKSNKLTGSIPVQLGNLESLTGLYLQDNKLRGAIPIQLGSLLHLIDLDLSDNELRGNIPSSLGDLSVLRYLNLANNQLSGDIPSTLLNLTIMNYLNLEGNKFVFSNIEFLHAELSYIPTYKISPQKPVDRDRKIDILSIGATLLIKASLIQNYSNNDKYAWYKDGVLIEGVIDHTFSKNSVSKDDEGVYTYKIINTLVPELTLKSHNEFDGIKVYIGDSLRKDFKDVSKINKELNNTIKVSKSINNPDLIINSSHINDFNDGIASITNRATEENLVEELFPIVINVLSEDELALFEVATLQIVGTEEAGDSLVVENEGKWSIEDDKIIFTPLFTFKEIPKSIFYTIKDVNGVESNPIEISIKRNKTEALTVNLLEQKKRDIGLYSVTILLSESFKDKYPESILSEDRKKLTLARQGIWKVEDNGTATFSPDEGFKGEPVDIEYLVLSKSGDKSAVGMLDIKYKLITEENMNTTNNVGLFGIKGLLLMVLLGGLFGMFYIREVENKKL